MAPGVTSLYHGGTWYSPRSIARSIAIRPRLYCSAAVGILALLVLPGSWSSYVREALAWDLSAAIYLLLAFRVMLTCTGDAIKVRAARQDNSRIVVLIIVVEIVVVRIVPRIVVIIIVLVALGVEQIGRRPVSAAPFVP